MKVFLDTNVLASATATRGLCADVLRNVISSHELVISDQLLDELTRILDDKFGLTSALIFDVVQLLQLDTEFSTPLPYHVIDIQDNSDIRLLSSAINGNCDVFVTGDKELLGLQQVGKMKIVSPRKFWEIVTSLHDDQPNE